MSEYNVLIIGSGTTSEQAFIKGVMEDNPKLEVTLAKHSDLAIYILDNNVSIRLEDSNKDIASFDLVYFKSTSKHQDISAACAIYLDKRKVKYIDKAIRNLPAISKTHQCVSLIERGIKVPDSIFMPAIRLMDSYSQLKESLGLPFILKDTRGKKGKFNYLIKDEESFNTAITETSEPSIELIAQEYIPNESDYRLLVFGEKVYLIIKRQRGSDLTHLNNVSAGGKFSLVSDNDIPKQVLIDAADAARALDRQVVGVDMIENTSTGQWYCLEVNEGPQLSSGVLLKEKELAISKFLEEYL